MPRIAIYKYKETEFFKFLNVNPKGKAAGDCVARAISQALGKSWEDTIREMTEFGIKKGYTFNEDKTVKAYLESQGYTTYSEPRNAQNKKISLKEFLKWFPHITAVVKVGSHHITYVKDGKCYDSWDCTKNTVHRYWRKA